jgi:hypothetical protein
LPFSFPACILFFRFSWGRRLSGIAPFQWTFDSVPASIFDGLGGFEIRGSDFCD